VLAPPGILQAIKKSMAFIQGRCTASFPQTYLSEYNAEICSDCWLLYLADNPNQSLEMNRSGSANFLNFCVRHIQTMMEQDKPPPQFTADEWRARLSHVYLLVQAKLEASCILPTPINEEIDW
jgi:hypothetical protein